MRHLSVHRDIALPPALVWDVLVDVNGWPRWGPTVRAAELDTDDGDGRLQRGSRGKVTTVGRVRMPFVITEYQAGRQWSWKVAGVPATSHTVSPIAGGARVTFGVPWVVAPYLAICCVGLRRLASVAGQVAHT